MMECVEEGIYFEDGNYYTLNLVPGQNVYGEELLKRDNFEYRRWDPDRSKLCAFLEKEGSLPLQPSHKVLYLGAGDGTTVSHLSDILAQGKIFAVEVARKPFRNLLSLSKERKNIYPIMGDARDKKNYKDIVDKVDFLYQDISQRDQTTIFLKNLSFLKKDSFGILAVKSRSINVSKKPKEVYRKVKNEIRDEVSEIVSTVDISKRQKDHSLIVVKK